MERRKGKESGFRPKSCHKPFTLYVRLGIESPYCLVPDVVETAGVKEAAERFESGPEEYTVAGEPRRGVAGLIFSRNSQENSGIQRSLGWDRQSPREWRAGFGSCRDSTPGAR